MQNSTFHIQLYIYHNKDTKRKDSFEEYIKLEKPKYFSTTIWDLAILVLLFSLKNIYNKNVTYKILWRLL